MQSVQAARNRAAAGLTACLLLVPALTGCIGTSDTITQASSERDSAPDNQAGSSPGATLPSGDPAAGASPGVSDPAGSGLGPEVKPTADGYVVRPEKGTVLNSGAGDSSSVDPGNRTGAGGTSRASGDSDDDSPDKFKKVRIFAIDAETGTVFPDFIDWLVAYRRGDPAAVRLAPFVLSQRDAILAEAPAEARADLMVFFEGMEAIPSDRAMAPEELPKNDAFHESVNDLSRFEPERNRMNEFQPKDLRFDVPREFSP